MIGMSAMGAMGAMDAMEGIGGVGVMGAMGAMGARNGKHKFPISHRVIARIAPIASIASIALTACRAGEPVPTVPEPTRMPGREPMVRIGLKIDTAAVMVSAAGVTVIADRSGSVLARPSANEVWTFVADSANTITATSAAGAAIASSAAPLMFRAPENGVLTVGDKVYRGDVLLRVAGPGRITAINVLELEPYLLGVVPYEIGKLKSPDIEAIKAQAVAARTYAVGNMGSRQALGFDFYATVADQVYGGAGGEDSVVSRAVFETRGEILTHAGQPIIAYYSSTCGGHTADVNESWPWRAPQPYLKGRPDTNESGEAYCRISNRFRWSAGWQGDSLRMILQQTLGQRLRIPAFRIQRLDDVRITGRSQSGRAEALEVIADGAAYRVPADSIRWVLRPTLNSSLNSSLIFDMQAAQSNGAVARLDVHGGGWGHGVGMCQFGAIGRARAGQNYRTILHAYYSDIEIQRLY